MSEWFCRTGQKSLGPLSSQQIKRMAVRGDLRPQDLVRRGGDGPWVRADNVVGLFALSVQETIITEATVRLPKPPTPDSPSAAPPVQSPPREVAVPPPVQSGGPLAIKVDVAGGSGIRLARRRPAPRQRTVRERLLVVGGLAIVLLVGCGVWWLLGDQQQGAPAHSAGALPGTKEAKINFDDLELGYNKELAKKTAELKPTAPVPAAPQVRWYDAAKESISVKHADEMCKVRIKQVKLGVPPRMESKGDRLIVTVCVENVGAMRPVGYRCWGLYSGTVRDVKLVDDQGKSYRPTAIVSQRSAVESIPPGKVFEDTLLFEPPAKAAKQLRLELPGSAIGLDQPLRFEIPVKMVEVASEAMPDVADAASGPPGPAVGKGQPLDIGKFMASNPAQAQPATPIAVQDKKASPAKQKSDGQN